MRVSGRHAVPTGDMICRPYNIPYRDDSPNCPPQQDAAGAIYQIARPVVLSRTGDVVCLRGTWCARGRHGMSPLQHSIQGRFTKLPAPTRRCRGDLSNRPPCRPVAHGRCGVPAGDVVCTRATWYVAPTTFHTGTIHQIARPNKTLQGRFTKSPAHTFRSASVRAIYQIARPVGISRKGDVVCLWATWCARGRHGMSPVQQSDCRGDLPIRRAPYPLRGGGTCVI